MTATAEERAKMTYTDYLRPIIADADTGCVNFMQEDGDSNSLPFM